MRILFVNSARPLGGGVTAARELAGGLAERGHDMTVVVRAGGALEHRLKADPLVQIRPLGLGAELNLVRAVQLAGVIHRVRPDVLLADRRKDIKFSVAARALTPHGRRLPIIHRHGAPSVLRNSVTYRILWQRVQRVVVNSRAMQAGLLRTTPWLEAVGIRVIHNGKDPDEFRPLPEVRDRMRAEFHLPRDAFVVCYHGILQPRKNVDVLLEALAELGGEAGVHALIVGDGPAQAALRETAAARGIEARFTGTRSDIADVLAAADAGVHLSSAEGFSNAVIEAMACGLPVIASRASSHPEQIGDGVHGLLVTPGDAREVAGAIRRLRDDAGERRRLAAGARQRAVRDFSLAGMVEAYERVFDEVRDALPPRPLQDLPEPS